MSNLDAMINDIKNKKYHLFYSHTLFQQRIRSDFHSDLKNNHVRYKRITDQNLNDIDDIVTITEAVQATPENSGDNLASFIETRKIVSDTIYLGIGTWYSSTPL